MIITARAIYKQGRLIFYNSEEIPKDGTEVTVNFEKRLETPVFSLQDCWSKYFPKEIDLDKQLEEIRKEWEQEMEEINE